MNLKNAVRFELTNYSGSLPSHPQAEPVGTLAFPKDQLRWELHWLKYSTVFTPKHSYTYGNFERYQFDAVATGSKSCRVTMSDSMDSGVSATFELPKTSKADFDAQLAQRLAQVSTSKERAVSIAAALQSGTWWAGLAEAKLYPVIFGRKGEKGTLKVTNECLQWSQGLGKTKIPFAEIKDMHLGEVSKQAGKQHSAFGFGAVGVAFVAATAVHNHRAARVNTYNALEVTLKDGRSARFLTEKSWTPLVPFFDAFVKSLPKPVQAPANPIPIASKELSPDVTNEESQSGVGSTPLGIADELAKLAELVKQGILTEEEMAIHKKKLLGQ